MASGAARKSIEIVFRGRISCRKYGVHYFKSKDEIADAVVHDAIARSLESFRLISDAPDLKAIEKMLTIFRFFSQETSRHYQAGLMKYLHHEDNVRLHQKMKVAMIKEFVPVISAVVRQGVKEDVFHTDFPQEITEFLLVGLHFGLDPSYFSFTHEKLITKLDAVGEIFGS